MSWVNCCCNACVDELLSSLLVTEAEVGVGFEITVAGFTVTVTESEVLVPPEPVQIIV